jgi:F-type H+-transporting ATPase subunit alpha
LSVSEMAVILFAADKGYLDDIALNKIADFEQGLLSYMRSNSAEFMTMINETGNYNDDIANTMKGIVEKYKAMYV